MFAASASMSSIGSAGRDVTAAATRRPAAWKIIASCCSLSAGLSLFGSDSGGFDSWRFTLVSSLTE